jgi:hypothetical protein
MMRAATELSLAEEFRREVFAALIDAFSPDSSPHQSRIDVAHQYDLNYAQVSAIEQQGVEEEWEPL